MTLGEALREARIASKLTQQEVADRLEINRVAVTNWELGKHSPKGADMPRVALAFGTTAAALYRAMQEAA